MATDWPFLHLNLLSPNPSSRELSNNLNPNQSPQDLSLHSIELDRQLEAWTNIDFNFDLDPITTTDTNLPNHHHHHHGLNHHHHHHHGLNTDLPINENSKTFDELFSFPSPNFFQPTDPTHHNLSSSNHLVSNLSAPILNDPIPTDSLSITTPVLDSSQDLSVQFSPKSVLPIPSNLSVSQSPESQTLQNKNVEGTPSTEKPELDDDEANKVAIEDDKRRRNTLASARFRMKKKLKEQEIERSAKEMKDKVNELEKEVESLKQENKWLRGLIVEQAANKSNTVQSITKDLETNLVSNHQPEPTNEPESLNSNPISSRSIKSNPKKSTSNAKRIKLTK